MPNLFPRRFTRKPCSPTISKTPRSIFWTRCWRFTTRTPGCSPSRAFLRRTKRDLLIGALERAGPRAHPSRDLRRRLRRSVSSSSKRCCEAELGRDVAGKMHTARSRNDIAITLYRMTARRETVESHRGRGASANRAARSGRRQSGNRHARAHPHAARAAHHAGALSAGRLRISGARLPARIASLVFAHRI